MKEKSAHRLIATYRESIRPFLAADGTADLSGADQAVEVLEDALKYPSRLSVGFVGESQVGKSSLINALLGRTTLPSGGIGPLTASATRVRYAADPAFEVEYHGKREVHQLAFSLETHLMRRGKSIQASERTAPLEDVSAEAVPPDPADIVGDDADTSAARSEATQKMTSMIAQAKQLLAGDKSGGADAPDLTEDIVLEGLRAVLGYEVRCDRVLLAPFEDRITALRKKLGAKELVGQSDLGSRANFDKELRMRAAGWLSPLVAALHVELNADILRSLDLTDLPGIGVLGDPATTHAQRFVTSEGGDFVLVTRNNGVTAALGNLLEQTGVIRRLLFGGRDGRPAIHVAVVVTHLDDVARERYGALAEAAEEGEDVESPDTLFARLSIEMRGKVREQIRGALLTSTSFQDLPEAQRERREAVVQQLCDDLVVECVAAPDFAALTYRKSVASPPFLRTTEATGVPAVQRYLGQLATAVVETRDLAIGQAMNALEETLRSHLDSLRQVYGEGGGQAQAAWDSFRVDLERSLNQLKPQMAAFQGEAMAVLRREVPARIELMCANARSVALTKLSRLKVAGEKLHYQSLNAALMRDGIWDKRGINYPEKLTSALIDTIATDWEPKVIELLRGTLRDVTKRSLVLVEQLCDEAQRHDERIVADAQIDAQKKLLVQQSQTAIAWTKEKLEALRQEIQQPLYDVVFEPIAKACADAVRQKQNVNEGARRNILNAFDAGGQRAIEKATAKAQEVLLVHHGKLVTELNRGFLKEHHDPVQAAFDAMTNETLGRARRSDAQKRRKVLARLDTVSTELAAALTAAPVETV